MLTELAKQQNDIKAVRRRIAEAVERHKQKSAAKNDDAQIEKLVAAKVEETKDKWAEYQIEKNKPLWFSIVSHIKVTRLGGPHIKDIQKATCEVFGISMNGLLSHRQTANVTLPRQVSMYLAKELTTLSIPRIARATGDRDHSTAHHAIRKIEGLLKFDYELANKVDAIRERFNEAANRRDDSSNTEMVDQEAVPVSA
jgi:hypothetical protein